VFSAKAHSLSKETERVKRMREEIKQEIIDIAGLIWERRLSDTAGGNVSVRDGDVVVITPKFLGYRFHWHISWDDLSVVTLDGEILEGPEEISRESAMHLGLYRAFDDAGAVIHAHPYWATVFVARAEPIVPVLQATEEFGTIECIEEVESCFQELADRVIAHFYSKRDQWEKTPLEVILPRHGIVAMGKDLTECFYIVDQVETDCRCQILGKLLDMG
jgi:L-fuculose-phosphate aldolase